MKKIMIALFVSMISMQGAAAYAQATYYVQSTKAKVMSAPSFKAGTIAELPKGSKLDVLGKEGSWVKVKYNEREGYVSSLLLSSRPPMGKSGVIKGDDSEIKHGVRRRASSYTSAAAARGLAQDDRGRLSKEEKSDYDALEKIESYVVSANDLNKFMEATK